ncbi:MAG: alpha/beta fold hydrolase [Gammaproteobacteria bacterium]|nr:alpha/beta fold hydrolase [Gammaproteobacteria bacterium]
MRLRRSIVVCTIAMIGFVISVWAAGEFLSYPAHRTIGIAPINLPTEQVTIATSPNNKISGWLMQGHVHQGVVLLLHGVRGDRREMLPRARFLHQLGYTVFLIDLPAHGESDGDHISFGHTEAVGVNAALHFLRQRFPDEHIGAIGVSLGAASLVLAEPKPALDAVVLESMFPAIENAVDNRMDFYLGSQAHLLSPLLLWQLPLRLHVSPSQLRPISAISEMHSPLLIISGAVDRYTPLNETQSIYAAAGQPKSLWIIDGAAHVDLHDYETKEYEKRIGEFFAKYLPQKES